jgi:hypothetical protein
MAGAPHTMDSAQRRPAAPPSVDQTIATAARNLRDTAPVKPPRAPRPPRAKAPKPPKDNDMVKQVRTMERRTAMY